MNRFKQYLAVGVAFMAASQVAQAIEESTSTATPAAAKAAPQSPTATSGEAAVILSASQDVPATTTETSIAQATKKLFDAVDLRGDVLTKAFQAIEAGADVNAQNEWGWTPLMLSSSEGDIFMTVLLLDNNADVNYFAPTYNGMSPLLISSSYGFNDLVNVLLENGADVSHLSNGGASALLLAAEGGSSDVISTLLWYGADPNVADKEYKQTPLMATAWNGNLVGAIALLENENPADINAIDYQGSSALIFASANGHVEVVEYLLSQQADKSLKNKDGLTALDLATKNEYSNIVQLLDPSESPAPVKP